MCCNPTLPQPSIVYADSEFSVFRLLEMMTCVCPATGLCAAMLKSKPVKTLL